MMFLHRKKTAAKEQISYTASDIIEKKVLKIPEMEFEHTHFDKSGGGDYVLILSMSTLPNNRKCAYYCALEEIETEKTCQIFSGYSQLEPGTKFFISKLAANGKKPKKIIILTTPETWAKASDGKSAIDVYSENILKFIQNREDADIENMKKQCYESVLSKLKEKNEQIEVKQSDCKIKISYEEQSEPFNKNTESFELNELNKYIDVQTINLGDYALLEIMDTLGTMSKNNFINIFIDLQGGSRTFMFTMFATITLLRDKNVNINDMFAINYDWHYDLHPIKIVNNEYAILDLVSGIRAFTKYGKVDELERFLEKRQITGKERDLLDIMKNIDGNMQINNPEGFTTELNKLADNGAEKLTQSTYSDPQFKLIVGDLKETYDPLLDKHSVLDQIKWFNDKGFIASALTFIEAKIPKFILKDTKIISCEIAPEHKNDDIKKLCGGGYDYYEIEGNIFNFGLKKIIKDEVESKIYSRICDVFSEEIIKKLDKGKIENVCFSKINELSKVDENINENKTFPFENDTDSLQNSKNYLSKILYFILIDNNDKGKLDIIVNNFLGSVLKKVGINAKCDTYDIWIKIMTGFFDEKGQLNNYIDDFCSSDNSIVNLEMENAYNTDVGKLEKEQLIEFYKNYAKAYIECQNKKNSKEFDYKTIEFYYDYNFKNITNINLKTPGYKKKMYIMKDSGYFRTIAGIREKNRSEDAALKIVIGVDFEERELLEWCLLLYDALKKERNSTNHAADKLNDHMDYRYTKRAIDVFVALCRELEKHCNNI